MLSTPLSYVDHVSHFRGKFTVSPPQQKQTNKQTKHKDHLLGEKRDKHWNDRPRTLNIFLFSVQSRLESKLCKLYKNMLCLKETLQNQCSSTTSAVLTSHHISQPIRERLTNHVTIVSDMLRDCSEDLLSLSVLYPAAPWVRYSVSNVAQSVKI